MGTEETTEQIFDETMNINVRAPFFLTKALLPYMPRGGRIILISSIAARRYSFGLQQTAYAISKAAVEGLARNWGVEVSTDGPGERNANMSNSLGILKA